MKDLKDMKRVLLKLSGEALAGDKENLMKQHVDIKHVDEDWWRSSRSL